MGADYTDVREFRRNFLSALLRIGDVPHLRFEVIKGIKGKAGGLRVNPLLTAKVRTGTRRRISGVTRRVFLVCVASRGVRKQRSIVAALIVSTLVRTASSSFR